MKSLPSLWFFSALVASVSPALAFDCSKATTKIEKAICADANLKSADAEMTKVYADLRDASSPAERKMLSLSQRRWIDQRENACAYADDTELVSCVYKETDERKLILQGAPESGPGIASQLIPVFLQQIGTPKIYDLDYTLLRFANPQSAGEKLFNAESKKILDDAPLGPHGQEVIEDHVLARQETFAISYASSALLSVADNFYSDDGGAHGNGGVSNFNIDMRSGKEIMASDVFGSEAIKTLTAECRDQILARKQENYGDEKYVAEEDPNFQETAIAEHLNNFQRWTISADKAVVTFDSYAIGAYAEGPYECAFDMPELKSLAKPDALLP
jgi:uncharacterized protein YecT (DUF1311 family)